MKFEYLEKEIEIKYISTIFLLILFLFNNDCYEAKAEIIFKKEKELSEIEEMKRKIDKSKVSYFEPNIAFLTQKSEKVSLKDFRGNTILVYFWATYCGECLDALKKLEKMSNEIEFKQIKNIKILPISVDYKKPEKVIEIIKNKEIVLDLYYEKSRKLLSEFNTSKIPSTFIIDGKGIVRNEIIEELIKFDNPEVLSYLQKIEQENDKKK